MTIRAKTPLILITTGALALSGCLDSTGQTTTGPKTKDGAIIGAIVGGAFGATRKGDDKLKKTAIGAAVGAAVGGLIGARLDQQEADLRRAIGSDEVGIVNTGSELIVTMPQDILFAVDSASLRPDLQSDLRALAANLRDYPDTTVDVIGHTDNTGLASYNQNLSSRRASSVAGVLINSGVSASRIRAFGRGEDEPVASNLTAEGRQQNRRVEIVIRPIT